MADSLHTTERRRSRLWRSRDAWDECEVAPCGEAGGLSWIYSHRMGCGAVPDISDCLVSRPKPFRMVIWEPLSTKAPGPHLAQAYCCYINSVIFYHRPYVKSPWKKIFQYGSGKWSHNSSAGHFEEWDSIETRFIWDQKVGFNGDTFVIGGGTVFWAREKGKPNRWWMRRGARREVRQ